MSAKRISRIACFLVEKESDDHVCRAREGGCAHTCARADLAPICTCGCDPRYEYYVIKCALSNGKRIIVFGQQLVSEERTDHEGASWGRGGSPTARGWPRFRF